MNVSFPAALTEAARSNSLTRFGVGSPTPITVVSPSP
jgi:hypothetical protein